MSWHTSAIFIHRAEVSDFRAILAQLGFPGDEPIGAVSFEDATSATASGRSLAQVNGWTVVCDPSFFTSGAEGGLPGDEVWSPAIDRALRGISASGGTVFGFITEGGTGTHGFTLYQNGSRIRMRLIQSGSVLADEGAPLPEEKECFGHGGPFDQEQGLLRLMERLCVPLHGLDKAVFRVFGTRAVPGQSVPHSIADLSSPSAKVRREAVAALTKSPVEVQSVLPALIESLRDADISVAIRAAEGLALIGPAASAAIAVMTELLGSDDENGARGCMAVALGQFGPLAASAVPGLLQLLHDEGKCLFQGKRRNYPVRFRAAFALAKIAPDREEIISVLQEAMHYAKLGYAQSEAFEVIGRLGPHAAVFLPELRSMANDPNALRRASAQMTLASLDPNYRVTDPIAQTALAMEARADDQ